MERVSFEIERQDVADALYARAEAQGRTIAEELAALVERTYVTEPAVKPAEMRGDNWVDALIRIADGAHPRTPEGRGSERMVPDFPAGMEPLPGETMADHIVRISRPGFDLAVERDRTPHGEPRI